MSSDDYLQPILDLIDMDFTPDENIQEASLSNTESPSDDEVPLTTEDECIDHLKIIYGAINEKWPSQFKNIINRSLEDFSLSLSPTRSATRNSKFTQPFHQPRLETHLQHIRMASGVIPHQIIPNPDMARSLQLCHLDTTLAQNSTAALAARFGVALLFHEERQSMVDEEQFDVDTRLALEWRSKKYTMFLQRCRRISEPAEITGNGGATLFSTYFSVQDIENINEQLWCSFLSTIRQDSPLLTWLHTNHLPDNTPY
jgi:hypothetical protein